MGGFKLGTMTLKGLFKKPETIMYPVEVKPFPEGLKGHIKNDVEGCILCSKCQKVCPTGAIVVTKEDRTWAIDRFRCIQCGNCWRECPKETLSMQPTYAQAAGVRSIETFDVPDPKAQKKEVEAETEAVTA